MDAGVGAPRTPSDDFDAALGDLRARIADAPMAPLQVAIVSLCVLLNMLDGMDVVALSFAAPVIATELGLEPGQVGALFSAGLFGMMLGCLFIAPRADTYGRKPVLLASLAAIAAGMFAAAAARSFEELVVARAVTGLGVGGILPALASIATEFSNARRRDTSVGFVQAGWPLGAIITGVIASVVLTSGGWRLLFALVGGLTAAALPLVAWLMPESLEFLAKRQPPRARERIDAILARLGRAAPFRLPPPPSDAVTAAPVLRRLLAPSFASTTIRLWIGVFFGFITLYTLISWVPTFAKSSGMSLEMAIHAGTALNAGALLGSVAIGPLALRFGLRWLIAGSFFVAVALMAVYGHVALGNVGTLLLILLIGVTVQGGFNAYYPAMARAYPAELRASGIGYAVGLGRVGAVAGPLIAGWFLAAHVPMATLFLVFSVPLVLSAFAVLSLRSLDGGR